MSIARNNKESLREKIKLRDRCKVLVEAARSLSVIYESPLASETQKHYIETILGAAIWYLPTSKELWNGRISEQVLFDFHPNSGIQKPKMTEDHEYPRKVSALELIRKDWSGKDASVEMLELYLKKYGRFSYITSTENKILVKFQKANIFETPEIAYSLAGIRLIKISVDEFNGVRKRNKQVIDYCLAK